MVAHLYRTVNGIQLHSAELGEGPVVLLCHGFPELWYAWRHQMKPLAEAGYHVVAVDLRGFGESSAPAEVAAYAMEHVCADAAALIDVLTDGDAAVVIGHDLGGILAWTLALAHPGRVRAVASLNVPLIPHVPLAVLEHDARFDYILYFQEPGVAEAELETDVERSLRLILRSTKAEDIASGPSPRGVRERGGLLLGMPDLPRSVMLTEEDLDRYAQTYRATGFRGGLNWYRNYDRNAKWTRPLNRKDVQQPALMVTVGNDPALAPELAQSMVRRTPRLTRAHIEDCGHFSAQEEPLRVTAALVEWLATLGG